MAQYRLTLHSIGVQKKRKNLLSDITLQLGTGITALLGRNGAGKTSLMRVLAGVDEPTSGEVRAQWADDLPESSLYASKSTMSRHRQLLGWVPQAPGYPPHMQALHFVEYAAWLKKANVQSLEEVALDAMKECLVANLRDRKMASLSGGERQRVILASAIVGGPEILLLDEPTAGLDPAQRAHYLDLLRAKSAKTTILYSTHILEDVVGTADRVIVLENGLVRRDFDLGELAAIGDHLSEELRDVVVNTVDRNA